MKLPVSSHSRQHLELSVFFLITISSQCEVVIHILIEKMSFLLRKYLGTNDNSFFFFDNSF